MIKQWLITIVLFFWILLSIISYFYWDILLAIYCKGLRPSVLAIADIVTTLGDSLWYFIILVPVFIYFWFLAKNKLWSKRIIFILLSLSISGLLNLLIKWLAGRYRPNMLEKGYFGFNYFGVGYDLNSFPSGHTVTAFSLAAAVSILFPRAGIAAFIIAISIGITRIILTSHYLSDVIAGAGIGILCTLAVKYYFDRKQIKLTTEM